MLVATLLLMYVSTITSPIQLVVLYMNRKTTICASIGYFAKLFAKKLKNIRKYFILVPLSLTCSQFAIIPILVKSGTVIAKRKLR